MIKILFFDYKHIEIVEGFKRKPESPEKYSGNPTFISDHPLEANWISFYGSVIRRPDGLWQMWYTTAIRTRKGPVVGYAESEDGIKWERVEKDVMTINGRKTHFVFDREPHGPAIIYDEKETRKNWKYKMMCGASPSGRISVFHSADGIYWFDCLKNPVIGTNPDCPVSFLRLPSGKYVAYHRPCLGDRRIARSESWDFLNWSEAKIVIDQSPEDPPQIQFYGMGAATYGNYEIGTLWIYHTDVSDTGFWKMHGYQEPEFVYTRTGYAWHRLARNSPFIPRGKDKNDWDCGQIQPASTPVFLEDEIRFYYVGTRTKHEDTYPEFLSTLKEPACGIGYARLKPDRFVGLVAQDKGVLITRPFWTDKPQFFINAKIKGFIKVEITDISGKPVEGFDLENSISINGDSIYHQCRWKNNPDPSKVVNKDIRFRIQANDAIIYSLMAGSDKDIVRYRDFGINHFTFEREKIFL